MQASKTQQSNLFSALAWLLVDAVVAIIILGIGTPIALISPTQGHRCLKLWAKLMARFHSVEVIVIDENEGKYDSHGTLFLTLNQTSLSEGFIGTIAIPTPHRLVMSIQFALFPFLGWIYVAMRGTVLIQSWKAQAKAALNRATHQLSRRANFWMSIEGKRSTDGNLCPYKKGAFVFAINAKAKIVPIVYRGAREVLPYGEWRIRSGKVYVILCKAIDTQGMSLDDRDVLLAQLKKTANLKIEELAGYDSKRDQ